jgi:O-glycosyl hydrolase/subtilisin-like proprotein convertase family protein
MRTRSLILLLCLLCLGGAWFFWPREKGRDGSPSRPPVAVTPAAATSSASTAPKNLTAVSTNTATSAKTNPFAWRLSNTTKSLGQLMQDRHAILLENALIDSSQPLNLSIPKNLRSQGDPGAYIVQARGPIDNAFRAMLATAGAEIVSYIPNDAYLVRAPAGVANGLAGNPLTQAVIPYEPYYKISSSMPVTVGQKSFSSVPTKTNRAVGPSLLALAVKQSPLPAGTYLTLGLFKDGAAATVAQIEKLGGQIVARDNSPFGPVVRVQPPQNWTALAALPGVQIVEPLRQRVHANDLSRATVGVAADTQVATNYLGLTGSNVVVEVNDSGIDATHPDFRTGGGLPVRVFGDSTLSLVDTNGHGTHVAGIIAGDGTKSTTVTNAQGSMMPGTNGQFRGMAPLANLYSVAAINNAFTFLNVSDQYMQQAPALTNALISNNSWNYGGDNAYDLSAASYDAAVRDALPAVTGSQPVLFVFSSGNDGGGGDGGSGGNADTILSPATAKNVITVGALEQLRNITNIVTQVANGVTNPSTPWQAETDTGYSPFGNSVSPQVAGYSSRGNVGIGTEGTYGRYKPDVVAPGTFVISTRSSQWDEEAYYNPTNYSFNFFTNQVIDPNTLNNYNLSVPANAVGVMIQVVPNILSPSPFPTNLPIYVRQGDFPTTNVYDFVTWNNEVAIPPNSGGSISGIISLQNSGFYFAVGNTNSELVFYDLVTEVITTNQNGNYFQVLSNLNDSLDGDIPPHYYRYETGTSMSAADVSGVLALMQDYFTNTLHATPSPALLKAMLINGARSDGNYDFQVQNPINYQGWGLINLPDSLPPGLTTSVNSTGESMLMIDQSPTNALATGDSHTYLVTVGTNNYAQYLPLQVTLAWTDPPGDPIAAIKLVNNLDLVVSNADTGEVFYGNDIGQGQIYNTPEVATNTPNLDSVNNVQNVFIQPLLGTQYSITVIGRSVNVNAVTAQTNNAAGNYAPNVVQDYALVISCGEGEVTNAFTVTDNGITNNPTTDQDITFVITTNAPLLNQFVGASTPLLGTNTIPLGTNLVWGGTNGVITLGMTNQWHFYVVINNAVDASGSSSDVTNAAFTTFIPDTLSIPRMGVFAGSQANATRPEADIDLYVTTDPTLTNLNPVAISNCINGAQVGASSANTFNGASLGRGGTEYVVDTNSTHGQVYYVGVYSEDQMASEYGFISLFSSIPFSQPGPNGSQIVNGLPVPVNVPDGSPLHPGSGYVFGLALYPMQVRQVTVTNIIAHQNFGDLIGTLTHGGNNGLSGHVVLNNHDSLYNSSGIYTNIYADSSVGAVAGSQHSDGPGSLNSYVGQQGNGVWLLTEVDDALTHTGSVQSFTMLIEPHQKLLQGITATVPPGTWFYDYIDAPVGNTSLTVTAVDETPIATSGSYLTLAVKLGSPPTLADTNNIVLLTNSVTTPVPGLGNSISVGPPLTLGRYFVGIFNPDSVPHTVFILATLNFSASAITTVDFRSTGPVPILDDAVTNDSIFVTNTDIIQDFNVGLRVDHPRISDLVFHLISPDGTRYLLMENRGGTSTSGCGATIITTNIVNVPSSGSSSPSTNFINVGGVSGTLNIAYNFYTVPDQMTVYASTNATDFNSGTLLRDTGMIPGSGQINLPFNTASGFLTIIMNQFGGVTNFDGFPVLPGNDLWTYTAGGLQTNILYLAFTEDTNLTTTPIKFAPPPFVPATSSGLVWADSFEAYSPGIYTPAASFGGGWVVLTNQVLITNAPTAYDGTQLLALMNGAVLTNLPTEMGQKYILSYALGSSAAEGGGTATNANWQVRSLVFTAGQNGTPLVLAGSADALAALSFTNAEVFTFDTNALLDDFSLTEVPGNLYYQPEESIQGINNQSAYGEWTLEIQDDRAGDVGTLQSWQLEFVFANTNFIPGPPILTNGLPQTNVIPPGGLVWYQVNVPVNADMATNILLFATGPLNIWFDTNAPPTTNVFLFGGTNGSYTLSTTGTPPLAPGGTYYLGVQNTNSGAVTYGIEVDFHFLTGLPGLVCTVDWTNVYQRIDGFGASSAWRSNWPDVLADLFFSTNNAIIYTNSLGAVTTNNGIGLSLLRNHIIPANTTSASDTPATAETNIMQKAQARGANVWSTPWTPADGFKDNNGPDGGNYLGSGANATNLAYASQLANYVASMKNQGINLYAISVQNEPDANITTYEACVWNGTQIHDFVTNLYNALVADGVGSTKIIIPESQNWSSNPGLYLPTLNDPTAAADVSIIADHNYDDCPPSGTPAALSTSGKSMWETEVSKLDCAGPFDGSITDGIYWAGRIHLFMTAAQANAWHYWWLISGNPDNEGLTDDTFPNPVLAQRMFVLGQWSRFVRPGYYRIDAANTSSALISAYKDSVSPGFAIVAVNTNATSISQTFVLTNFTAGAVTPWLTTSNLSLVSTNAVTVSNSSFTYTLPALSVVTFVGQGSTNIPTPLTNGLPQTNSVAAGGIAYYVVNVPMNADFATNLLLFATGPLNVWFDTNFPPTTNLLLLPDATYPGGTNGSVVLSAGTTPPLVPGSVYYLGVQNTNSVAVTYAIEVDFHLLSGSVTGAITGLTITATNIGGTNGFLLRWQGPTNFQYEIQWTTNLAPVVWNTVLNPVINVFVTPTNGHFSWFDDGTLTGGFGPMKFYRVLGGLNLGPITGGSGPATNTVLAGAMSQAVVAVPANAISASNFLISATGPLNVWFNQTNPPTGNTNAGDFLMLSATSAGVFVLTGSSVPPLVPGANYYLGFQNLGTSNVTFVFQVAFGFAPTNAVSNFTITATNIGGTNGFLLRWQGPTNFQYEIQWTTNLAPVVWNTVLNPVINAVLTPTNGHFSWFDDGTLTGGPALMKFYRVLGGLNLGPITGSGPATNTVLAGTTSQAVVAVPANAISASNFLISATGPLNVWFNQTNPPTGNTNAGDFLMLSATSAGAFVLTSNSVPPLVPGTNYYLGFQNLGTSNVTFVFQVAFGFAPIIAVSNFSITPTNGGIRLRWNGLTNYQYQVQWTINLAPPVAWNTISNIVLTSTTGIFTFYDDGSLTGGFGPVKFYRLIAWPFMTPIPQTLSISSVTVTNLAGTNDLVLRWSAPTNYQYGIQWTTNLTLPFSNWSIIASPVLTLTNGVYTFIDNGQTGPPASMKFFRLFNYP